MAEWNKLSSRGRVEDRRGLGGAMGGLGIGGLVLFLALNFLGGGDLSDVLPELAPALVQNAGNYNADDFKGEDSYEVFVSTVVGSNNDMWQQVFAGRNISYQDPELVLFRGATQSACGSAVSAIGPHYCSVDRSIYLDETFFEEMKARLGAEGGDVAEAYVIAHEMGHHAQNELGILGEVKSQMRNRDDNELSIKLELQADCFAGLWVNSIQDLGVFEPGEVREAIDAARAVGDDRIQSRSSGTVNPEEWTHGSSAQRVEWFNRGVATGDISSCDTFN